MAEYIEREAALRECDWYTNEFCECEYAIMPLKGALENLPAADVVERASGIIGAIPAADVRPVVVCADCEHNNHCLTQEFVDDCGKIPLDRNTFFCADGERRSNA